MVPRFFRSGTPGDACSTFSSGNFQYQTISFKSNNSGQLNVTFDPGTLGTGIFVTFHTAPFDPTNICNGYVWSYGSSQAFNEQFPVTPNTDMVMVVSGVANSPGVVGGPYTYTIDGILSDYACRTTADLRSGGSTDTVRITNQGTTDLPYTVQFVNALGTVQGKPVAKSLSSNQSASNSVGSLMLQAGIKTFNPANLLQIVTGPIDGMTESLLQSVYTPTNGAPPVMMVYTCEEATQPK
jgi:hypothetical protein